MVQKGSNTMNFFKSIYYSEFQWAIIKSFGLFLMGVRVAKEFAGVEIMSALPPPRP